MKIIVEGQATQVPDHNAWTAKTNDPKDASKALVARGATPAEACEMLMALVARKAMTQ